MTATVSRFDLGEKCSWSLAHTPSGDGSSPSTEASFGRAFHAIVARVINQGLGEYKTGPAQFIDAMLRAEGLDPEKDRKAMLDLDPVKIAIDCCEHKARSNVQAEGAFVFDPLALKARHLGNDIARKYAERGATDDDIRLTTDVTWVETDTDSFKRTLVIRDWKTGQPGTVEFRGNMQLGCAATILNELYDCDQVRVELAHPIGGGKIAGFTHTYQKIDLPVLRMRMLSIWQSRKEPVATIGSWCRDMYCPLIASCPRVAEQVAALVDSNPQDTQPALIRTPFKLSLAGGIQSDAQATQLYEAYRLARGVLDATEKALKAYADQHGDIKAYNGTRTWGPRLSVSESIRAANTEELLSVLGTHLPRTVFEGVVRASMTHDDLVRACEGNSKIKGAIMRSLRKAKMVVESDADVRYAEESL